MQQMKRFSLVALFSFLCAFLSVAQETENTAGVWTEVDVTKALPYNLSLDLGLGYRTIDWFDDSYRSDIGVGLSWKASKHWKIGAGYTFLYRKYAEETSYRTSAEQEYKYKNTSTGDKWDATEFLGAPVYTDADGVDHNYRGYNDALRNDTRVDEAFWRQKHRLYVDVAYTHKLWKTLRISVRERYQMTVVPKRTISRTRTRIKTTTKYREPLYDGDFNLNGYEEITKYWQEGDIIYAQDVTDPSNLGTPVDATASWLAEHDDSYLNTVETYDHVKRSKTLHGLRSRLKLSIDKKGWNWEPYVSAEAHNSLSDGMHLDKIRATVGVDYSISRQHKVGLGYVFNHENDDDGNRNIHAIAVGYNFKF